MLTCCRQIAVSGSSPFKDASIFTSQQSQDNQDASSPKLSSSRSYTLSLSPHFLYTRSKLISSLISSKVFRQLEFMAVGSWWIYAPGQADSENSELGAEKVLYRVPGNREDVFAANHISMKSKRSLMRLLRHITKPKEDEAPVEDEDLSMPFQEYLASKFSVPEELHNPLLSLSLSQLSQKETSAGYAIPRIERHLTSIGALGPGFGAVVAKYGGGAEILQVACRASAVGGGVYALDTRLGEVRHCQEGGEYPLQAQLLSGESLQTKFVFSAMADDPHQADYSKPHIEVARSVTVASATFPSLFPVTVEGAPMPTSTILMFPGETLDSPQSPPVYLQVHSSDTGECPRQQSKSTTFSLFFSPPNRSHDDFFQKLIYIA
jgi:RAB protein geranylgeranyltransferase component A